ncbi:hypothetical protein MXEN_06218 [Mycobacterium xenopi RIVM700367]|nr:hypothetical protein MXEN_06218 [Mycobacterium xenopi RIVM700367]
MDLCYDHGSDRFTRGFWLYSGHPAELLSIAMDDRDKDPAVVLSYLVGRPLAATEVYEAFGYRKSAYYKAAREGRLITADNLIRAAEYFGLNPVDLQVRYGLIPHEAVTEYVDSTPHRVRLRDLQPDPRKPPV